MALILSGTEGVSDVDGSAATPAVRGADTNTGIFFPAADTIAFAEGGAEVARITNTAAWSFGASGTATGTNGQVLTSSGSSAAPTWTTPSAGAMTLISTATPSGASSVDFTGLSTAYQYYVLAMKDILVSTNNTALRIQCSRDNGASFVATTSYQTNGAAYQITVNGLLGVANNFGLISSLRTDYPANIFTQLFVNASGSYFGIISTAQGSYSTVDEYVTGRTLVGQLIDNTNPVNAVRVLISSGTFSGTIKLYGVTA